MKSSDWKIEVTWDKFVWMFVALAILAVIVSARAQTGTGPKKVASATASAVSSIGQMIVNLVHVIVGAPSTSAPSLGG